MRTNEFCFLLKCISIALVLLACEGSKYVVSGKNNNEVPVHHVEAPTCSDVPDAQKFDCYPDAPLTEKECVNRGCCYSKPKNITSNSSLPPLNVPYCYYPSNYKGYSIEKVDHSLRGIHIKLRRVQPSGFPKDSVNVNVLVSYIDENSLRIKITDADSQRYEVPTQLHYQTKETVKSLYEISLDSVAGIFRVIRTSTKSVVFKTNLFRLIFSDQFLQLSSDLPSSNIYGIGEHYEKVLRDVNWKRFTLINSDLSPKLDHGLYGSHPFYMALENDGKASGVFLYNSNIMDVILQPTPAITFRPIGGIFDFYIMLGPSPNDVSRQYSNIVGNTFMPPFWSLGFHLCRYGYNSLEETKKTMERTIEAGIPFDVQWNDIDYMEGFRDFTYDKVNFDGFPKFVDEVHSKGMHYILMIDPGLSNSEKSYVPYEEGVDDDIFVKNANGSILIGKVWSSGTTVYPDFSHPAAISFWTRQLRRLHDEIKYDGIWIDMNEPSNFLNGSIDGCPDSPLENPQYVPGGNPLKTKTLCMSAKHYYTTHYNEHNLYAYREAVATNVALKNIRNKRPFIISRASFAGQGVFSGHWSGDVHSTWEDLQYSVRSLINFNMYAMPMIGTDICGFGGNVTEELCARWQSVGAFYPFSRNHNDKDSIEQDPVAMGKLVVTATKASLLKRYIMLPYLYTLFYRSHVFGDTVIRPLFYEFPDDKNTYSIDEQFLWGPNVLIAPVLYPNVDVVEAYFPKGLWYNAVSGQQTKSSGEKINLNINVTDIHLSIRGGSILPFLHPAVTTTELRKNPFALAVALDDKQNAVGELYWDDGDSLETHGNGFYNLVKFEVKDSTLKSEIVNNGYKSNMNLESIGVVGHDKFPTSVSVNGQPCNHTSQDNLDSANDAEAFSEGSYSGIFSIVSKKYKLKGDDFCTFSQIGSVFMIQTKPVSLLSLEVSWK